MNEEQTVLALDDVDTVRASWLKDRIRLTACLSILEKVNTTLDQFPELTDVTTKRGKALANLKHDAQRELLKAWRNNEI